MAGGIDKAELLSKIIAQLSHDLDVLLTAAKTAHEAATHEETQPDNKYDTLALEASYVAQGQANRAQEIRKSLDIYRNLRLDAGTDAVRLTSLVVIEGEDGATRTLFIGPAEGGLRITESAKETMVITPTSPLGRELIGKQPGDSVKIMVGDKRMEYEIVEIR